MCAFCGERARCACPVCLKVRTPPSPLWGSGCLDLSVLGDWLIRRKHTRMPARMSSLLRPPLPPQALYCNRDCQVKHYPVHRANCASLAAQPTSAQITEVAADAEEPTTPNSASGSASKKPRKRKTSLDGDKKATPQIFECEQVTSSTLGNMLGTTLHPPPKSLPPPPWTSPNRRRSPRCHCH